MPNTSLFYRNLQAIAIPEIIDLCEEERLEDEQLFGLLLLEELPQGGREVRGACTRTGKACTSWDSLAMTSTIYQMKSLF